VALAAVEGVAGLWLSVEVNAPPGATIAVLAGAVFALAPLLAAARGLLRPAAPAAAAAVLLALAGCGSSNSGKPVVVATTTQLADFARTVGGNDITVHQILQPNTDPHEYEPRPNDIEQTAGAKVVFESGDGLDHWMSGVLKSAGSKATVVSLSDAVRTRLAGEGSEPVDPHWWHDPHNAEAAVERIRSALDAALPNSKQGIDKRAAAYVTRIAKLDKSIAACFATVPPSERKLVTSHDAFNYFAKRYGVQVVGAILPSQSTAAQPSAGDIARLVNQIKREHVKAVFYESSVNPKLGKAVAAQTGAIGNLRLYGDTLGPKGSPGATYLGMERANADAMMRGFTGGKRGCS
jgi:ABC-type Zn uptake system ZnuABC Zn-binding protein ZnuA